MEKAWGRQSLLPVLHFHACVYTVCVYFNVFVVEAGAEPGLTEDCWKELNSSWQQPGSCEEGETKKVTN